MAIGGAIIGLIANLAPWRKGVRDADRVVKEGLNERSLEPFNRGVDRATGRMGAMGKGLGSAFTGLGTIIGGLGIYAALDKTRDLLEKSMSAFDNYEDAIVKVRFAADTLPPALARAFDVAKTQKLAADLRKALGINETNSLGVYADFLTRGFNPAQANRMLVLAANAAVASGQPIETTADTIAKAFNGTLRPLRSLGIEINETKDKLGDIERAGAAVTAKFGKLGVELVDPVDHLRANLDQLYVVLGGRISPILNPIIQRVADFAEGLGQTEEGRRTLDGIGQSLVGMIETLPKLIGGVNLLLNVARTGYGVWSTVIGAIIQGIDLLFGKITGTAGMIDGLVIKTLSQIGARIAKFLNESTAGQLLQKVYGIDASKFEETFAKGVAQGDEIMRKGAEQWDQAGENHFAIGMREQGMAAIQRGVDGMRDGWNAATGEGSDLAAFFNRTADAAKSAREKATASVTQEIDGAGSVKFAGAPAVKEEAQKKAEAVRKAQDKSRDDHEDALSKQAARANVRPGGFNISITPVLSRGADRTMMRPARR